MSEVPPVSRAAGLSEAVVQLFSPAGTLPCSIPAFEQRDGQRKMAVAVADTLASGGVLLAEAGTGTGKTLAYLVPAILSRQRILVSTATKNLQDQIVFKDLPLLRDALGIPFTVTMMKGRGNYLCLHRFELFRQQGGGLIDDRQRWIAILNEWSSSTETGDRAEVEGLPDSLPLWNEIAASSENCIGTECPRYQDCFVTRMRQQAAESDVVIVNHHLLCADAAVRESAYGEVIPSCSHAIVDEAHQLEEVATQYFGITVSNFRFDQLARDGERLLSAGLLIDDEGELRRTMDRVRDRARLLLAALHLVVGRVDERVRLTPDILQQIGDRGFQCVTSLEGLEASIALVAEAPVEARDFGGRVAELKRDLSFLLRGDDRAYVYYFEARGRGLFWRASPIDVSGIVREFLFDRMHATILTSATLTVDGRFDYLRRRLGVRDAAEICVPSEFDYPRQALLYLPRRMPDPRSHDFAAAAAREIHELLTRSRGRAFVLFTSYAQLNAVEAVLRLRLPFPMLVQGTAPRSSLLERFRSTPNSVLLGTSSFWQGVDVVGDALSCVIVDKLPFASPADPVTAARMEAIVDDGGDPFTDYQVPLAILLLRQGLGRLIRHSADRGVLAVLDPRLRTKRYGERFVDSLPPARVTHDLEAVARFFDQVQSA